MQQLSGSSDMAFERNLKPRGEVSLSAFSFLFSEIVQQFMKVEKNGLASANEGNPYSNDLDQ